MSSCAVPSYGVSTSGHDGDARVYAEIWSDEDVNAWLICWSGDQDTGFLPARDRPAVTIHAYSPPLTRTGAYRIGPGGELEREALSREEELRAEAALAVR